ncbi:MAG: DUF599 domain-containing protein [Alphaproteobacteria bacterium]|nr:DUF599 domain-containing protein [Alphaproteobacteria bacterium]
MPFDMALSDALAAAWLLTVWLAYGPLFGGGWRGRRGLNADMHVIRRAWASAIVRRETRFTDAALTGHAIQSVSFFASTSMLVLAALVGMLGNLSWAFRAVHDLGLAGEGGRALFEAKALLLVSVFIYGFFKFTWALRQFNYVLALIGGAPPPGDCGAEADGMVASIAAVLNQASESVNAGIRSYYVALMVLAWVAGPWVCIGVTSGMLSVLLWRQFRSPAARAIAAQARAIEAVEARAIDARRASGAQYAEAGKPSEKPPSATNSPPVA